MPFRYDPVRSPYVGSIGDLIAREGEIRARAAMESGQAWAGAATNIGNAVAGTIQQQTDPRRQMETIALKNAQTEQAGQTALTQLQTPTVPNGPMPDGDKAPPQNPYMKKEGDTWVWDTAALGEAMAAQGKPLTPTLLKSITDFNTTNREEMAHRQQFAGTQQKLVSQAAGIMAGFVRAHPDIDLAQTGKLIGEQFAANGSFPVDKFNAALAQVTSDPATALAKLDALSRIGAETKTLSKDAVLINANDPSAPPLASNVDPHEGEYTINGQRFSKDHTPIGPPVPTQTAPPASQAKSYRVNGVGDVPLEFVPGRTPQDPGSYFLNKPDGTRQQLYPGTDFVDVPAASVQINNANKAGAPGDFSKSGEDFLASIPVQWRRTVQKIAHYDEDPTKVASLRGGNREMLMQWVNQVNPGYDVSQFTNRAPTRKAYTTGTQGQQITAINTAIGHLDQLAPIVAELNNGSFTPGNKAMNAISSIFGAAKVTNFETLKDALAGEVASVLSKGAATVSGIAAEKEKIQAASSPAQLAGYVKTLIPLMGSKLASLDYQYHQAMGDEDSFSALSPTSKTVLAKYGFDPAQHGKTDASARAGGGMIEALDPQGNIHHAPTGTPLPPGWKLK